MKAYDLGTKLKDCCERARISVERFQTENPEADRRTLPEWLKAIEINSDLRGPSPLRLIDYWRNRKIELEEKDFRLERVAFRKLIGLAPIESENTVPKWWHGLAGVYQVIRPHSTSESAYILEAMEIEIKETRAVTFFVSNDHPSQKYLYEGNAFPAVRYYFSLMSRTHESHDQRRAFRSIAFYSGEGRFEGCLSGILVKGMSGVNSGRELAGLPFVAIPIAGTKSLREIDKVALAQPDPLAEKLHLLYEDGSIIIGEVREKWYGDLFRYCRRIFDEPKIKNAISRRALAIHTVSPGSFKETDVVDRSEWASLVASQASVGAS
jgi:hypothetical protein